MDELTGRSIEINYTQAADKFFRRHETVRKKYRAAIIAWVTGDHPEKIDIKKISGKRNDYFRMRIGEYRVIYTIINGKIVVVNTLIAGSRGDIYKKMDGLK